MSISGKRADKVKLGKFGAEITPVETRQLVACKCSLNVVIDA